MDGNLLLVVPAESSRVRGSLLRLLAYVFAERLIPLMAVSDEAAVRHVARSFHFYRNQLASAIMVDVRSNQGAERYHRLATSFPETFTKFVFAETIDSHFCNATTAARAEERFPTLTGALRGNEQTSLLRDLMTMPPTAETTKTQ